MESFAGIETFVRVVEAGSVTGAAERLQTAKSSVSDAVRALEERLGVRLLERTTRSIRPTEAGRLFYARCRRLLDEAETARAEARAFQKAPAGQLRLAVPESFAERFIVPGVAGFLALYPSVEISLVSGARHVKLVEEEFDLAIRIAETLEPSMVARRIGVARVIIVAAPSYLAAHGAPTSPKEIARHRCVGIGAPLPWDKVWRVGGEEVGVRPVLLVNTADALRVAAITGVGIAPAPDWAVADAIAAGQLVRVLEEFETPSSGIYAVYPTNRLLTPVVRAFVDHLAKGLSARGLQP